MYLYYWLHSLVCGDCPDADSYWRLRAFRVCEGQA